MKSEILSLFSESKRPTGKYDTYFEAYDELFAKYKGKDVTFVEIGILGGGSLEAFKKYFGKNSRIIGVDLNPALKEHLSKDGFEIFIGDQSDPKFWDEFYRSVGKVDILLDDGGHTNQQIWTTLVKALPNINDGGLLVVEDTHASYIGDFGNPSRQSFINKVKECIDEINYRSCRIYEEDRLVKTPNSVEGLHLDQSIHSIHVYESIVAFSINRKLCRFSKGLSFGSTNAIPTTDALTDFRNKGIPDPENKRSLLEKIRRRLRKLTRKKSGSHV